MALLTGTLQNLCLSDFFRKYKELENEGVGPGGLTALHFCAAYTKKGIGELEAFNNASTSYINHPDSLGRTPLHYAAFNGNHNVVQFLLDHGAEPNLKCEGVSPVSYSSGEQKWWELKHIAREIHTDILVAGTALQFAIVSGSAQTVHCLLTSGADLFADVTESDYKTTVALSLCHNVETFNTLIKVFLGTGTCREVIENEKTGTSNASMENLLSVDNRPRINEELIQSIIDHSKPSYLQYVEIENVPNLPSLQYYAASKGQEECLKILATKGINLLYVEPSNQDTLLDKMFYNISKPESLIILLMDKSVEYKEKEITFDFSLLQNSESQSGILHNLCNNASPENVHKLMDHPLIDLYLKMKWYKVRGIFLMLLLMYVIFVVTLSTYLLMLIKEGNIRNNVFISIRYLLLVSAIFSFLHSFIQLTITWRKNTSKLELITNLICTTNAIAVVSQDIHTTIDPAKVSPWILHSTSIVIFLSWFQLMLMVGRFPRFGPYSLMFTVVLQNVVKVFATFVCLIVGFSLSFSIQFGTQYHFSDPILSFVKTTVMMMGEFDYADLFNDVQDKDAHQRLFVTSRIIFLLFIALVSVVLMNLMVGLAVNDIQVLQNSGYVRTYFKQTDFIRSFEAMLAVIKKIPLVRNMESTLDRFATIKSNITIHQHKTNYLDKQYKENLFNKVAKRHKRKANVDKVEKILDIIRKKLQKCDLVL